MDFTSLRRRYRTQKTLRAPYESVWDEIDYYTGPVKEEGATSSNPEGGGGGMEARKDLWDFTAIEGREKLSASIQGSVISAAIRWFMLTWALARLNADIECRSWLDEESENVWNDLQNSDFNTEMGTALHELCGPGNCFVAVEPLPGEVDPKTLKEEWTGLDFTHIPLRESFFEVDRKGDIRTFWRRNMWLASQVISHCEDNEITVPDDIKTAFEQGSDKKYEIVYCVFPRPDIIKRKKVRYPSAPDKRPWGCVWWREDTGALLGVEGGYYEKPIYWIPWSKTSGTKWGHGPGNTVLPTVKYINARMENLKAIEEKVINPTSVTTERNLLSDVDYNPGGLVVVRDASPNAIRPLESGNRVDVGYESIQDLRGQIRGIFHTDELQLKDSPAMTATEAQIRYEWMNRLLGKTLTFIESKGLGPMLLAIMHMRIRMGAAKPMPAKVKAAGGDINIEYQGPLARSQRTDEVAAIERGATFVAGLAQIFPVARAAFNPIKAIKHAFNRLGVPADIMPTDAEIDKAVKGIEQEQQRAMAADAAQKEAKAKESAAKAQATQGQPVPVPGAEYPALPPNPNLAPSGFPMA